MTRTETYEVVAPKGAILRAKADKSSEMLGVLAAGSLVDVDRTMKLQICGTRRARVVAPLAGVPHAWAEAHAHLLDPTDWVLNACEALEDLARGASVRRRCCGSACSRAALRRWTAPWPSPRPSSAAAGRPSTTATATTRRSRAALPRGLARAATSTARALLEGEAPEEDPVDPFGRTALLRRRRSALLAARDGARSAPRRGRRATPLAPRPPTRRPSAATGTTPAPLRARRGPRRARPLARGRGGVRGGARARAVPLPLGGARAGRALARCGRPGDAAPHFAAYLRGGHDPAVAEEPSAAARARCRAAAARGGARRAPPPRGPRPRAHYAALGAAYDDTADALKRKYRAVALRCHPDKTKAPGAEDEFKRANAAYEVLSDPAKRREYDERLRRGR
ncbi:hypothetical protein SO694_000910121 [Aureococcus anophagefferens]|uniref:J domain-containing protein n=1 Tax=Aureococcus anophagefferens TaxID=44056 RepID=A0ABR1FS12_AURAN